MELEFFENLQYYSERCVLDGWMPTSVRGRARAETLCTKQMSGLNRSPLPYLPSRVDWTAGAV